MNILVTGAKGFIGRNLVAELRNRKYFEILEYDVDSEVALLEDYCRKAEFVFHLAGINRPQDLSEYMEGNFGFTSMLLDTLRKYDNHCPIVLSSSTQATMDNPYGHSKKAGEDLLLDYSRNSGSKVFIYRFPNVFGKWCRPNYNSAIATFCHNVAHDLPITINDSNVVLTLVYIDDLVDNFIEVLTNHHKKSSGYCEVSLTYQRKLGEITDLIHSFKNISCDLMIPNMFDSFVKKLYSTYLSYLPQDKFSYKLKMNIDHRGSFTEFIKTPDRGQVSVNISKPGVTKGNHWHHTKNEKFLVVSGRGVIRFRKIDTNEVIEYCVSGEQLEVVDIPTGYTHNIQNLGDSDMVTVMWANELLDLQKPDTYYLEV